MDGESRCFSWNPEGRGGALWAGSALRIQCYFGKCIHLGTVSDGCCADAWRGRGGDVTMAFLLLFCSFALQGSEGTLFVAVRERSIAVLAAERGPVSYLLCTLIN